jgi:hypothetical protein
VDVDAKTPLLTRTPPEDDRDSEDSQSQSVEEGERWCHGDHWADPIPPPLHFHQNHLSSGQFLLYQSMTSSRVRNVTTLSMCEMAAESCSSLSSL